MAFSGALTLTDLNDYITPSQSCIKPVEIKNVPTGEGDTAAATTQIRVDQDGSYYEVSVSDSTGNKPGAGGKRLETAQVSLNDCLACSGCITSAESVLITMQSHVQVLDFLAENATHDPMSQKRKIPIVSIAPQSLASLAASVSSPSTTPVTPRQMLHRIETFFSQVLGIDYVYDTTFARHISLLEHAREFFERKVQSVSGTKGALPMISSACPGWVCYAEKTHSEMLCFISRTKSPQQVMGTIVKSWLASKWSKNPDQIYHVAVMPCYDKKLEASRQDFYNDIFSTRDVDCVITTGELELLMKEKSWDVSVPVVNELVPTLPRTPPPGKSGTDSDAALPQLISHPGTSSGSYLHTIIEAVRTRHRLDSSRQDPPDLELSVKALRSADYEEYTLTDKETRRVVFKGAKCYGFRNLQNIVRRVGKEAGVQTGKGAAGRLVGGRARAVKKTTGGGDDANLDYVEVMACPGGCINGGGQLKRRELTKVDTRKDSEGYQRDWNDTGVNLGSGLGARWGDKEWTKEVERVYWTERDLDVQTHAEINVFAVNMLRETCQCDAPGLSWSGSMDEKAEARRRTLFRTEYRAVESGVDGLLVKW
ncbi:iron hydrogenase [Thelephora ganbajun]|uniref:Iron hydrogenase n=1 Tax=Thelephora ganbajun TaxID=370292 RepID=A0ACB6ZCE4_THEGA|nr:iron hydrogenase [Thelephora ganbajun]